MIDEHNRNLTALSSKSYKINSNLLNRGAFGDVYVCRDIKHSKNDKVIKICSLDDKENTIVELNIFNKIKKHQTTFYNVFGLNESNIIKLSDYYFSDEYSYAIYERADVDLEEFIIGFQKKFNSRVPLFVTHKIIQELVNGLVELNFNNVIHCDLKLNNILIKFQNGVKSLSEFYKLFKSNYSMNAKDKIKILNAFSVKIIDLNKSTFINHIYKQLSIQTLEFQAPEIVHGNNQYTQTVDIWSIGVVMWMLLTGFQLIDFSNEREVYYPFYENYVIEKENISESIDTTSYYSSSNTASEYKSFYENYIYLVKLRNVIGKCDSSLIIGRYIDNYYNNNELLGFNTISSNCCENNIKNIINKETLNFKFVEDDINLKLMNYAEILKNHILVYDYKLRIDAVKLSSILKKIIM